MKSKVAEEIKLIALLAFLIPTAVLLTTAPVWWEVEPIKVFAGYLLGIIGTAALLGAISVHDEDQQRKEQEKRSSTEEKCNGR